MVQIIENMNVSQSDLTWLSFISYDACKSCFCLFKVKQTYLYFTFQHCSFKKIMATDLSHD